MRRFKVPFFIGSLMLLLGFLGVMLTDILKDGAWNYWLFVVFFFAVLSMAYHIYSKGKEALHTIWRELFHWVGLFLCIMLLFFMVKIGVMSRFVASLQILIFLAFTTYLIGVYFDKVFVLIGVALGLFAASIAFFDQYLYLIIIPVIAVAIGILTWINTIRKK